MTEQDKADLTDYESIPLQIHLFFMRLVQEFIETNQFDKTFRIHVAGIAIGKPMRTFRRPLPGPARLIEPIDHMTQYDYLVMREAIRPFKVQGIIPSDMGSD